MDCTCIENVKWITTSTSAHWTEVDLEPPIDLRLAQTWREKRGEWEHGGSSSKHHNEVGMAFGQWVLDSGLFEVIHLSDMPDFHALMHGCTVLGDIGRCSAWAMLRNLQSMTMRNALWMTVFSAKKQILIEFPFSPGELISTMTQECLRDLMKSRPGGENRTLTSIDGVRFCGHHAHQRTTRGESNGY